MMLKYWLMFSLLSMTYCQYMAPLCNTTTHKHTIIDIKSSVAHNAKLLNGTLERSLADCVQRCCEIDQCDLAVFKNSGTSPNNRNCYFVHCGVDQNCVLVEQTYFTVVSLNKDIETTPSIPITSPDTIAEVVNSTATTLSNSGSNRSIEEIATTTSPTPQVTSSIIQQESKLVISHTTSFAISTNTTTTSSSSYSTSILSITSTSSVQQSTSTLPMPTSIVKQVDKISDTTETVGNKKVMPTSSGGHGPEKVSNSENHQLCGNADCSHNKTAGLAVACVLVALLLIIVIIVVVKKSWNRHRTRRYKKIDYLIDGMYS